MPQPHPYLNIKLPSDAPFELRPSPGKGWGAFATRDIKTGTEILRERPLFTTEGPPQLIKELHLALKVAKLTSDEKSQLNCVRYNEAKRFLSLRAAYAEHSFSLSTDPRHQANGFFVLLSRFNHSCIPKAKIPFDDNGVLSLFAVRDIAAGEEITFCYNPNFEFRASHVRHRELRFTCDCKACLPGTPFRTLSNVRRTLIRGLQFLLDGKDPIEQQQGRPAALLIVGAALRKAAETFSIRLSARLIYHLLTFYLLEQEELLDNFTLKERWSDLMVTVQSFESEDNIRIVKAAMAQKSLLAKFCNALRLYGRDDVADAAFAETLRGYKEDAKGVPDLSMMMK